MTRTNPRSEPRLGPREGEARLVRKRKANTDAYHIPPELIPPGVSYEWKRKAVYGQPDHAHMLGLKENHWTEVPVSRLPHMMPEGHTGCIERGDLVLMERPAYLTEEAMQEMREDAFRPIQAQQARLGDTPSGTLERTVARVRTSFDDIPE